MHFLKIIILIHLKKEQLVTVDKGSQNDMKSKAVTKES